MALLSKIRKHDLKDDEETYKQKQRLQVSWFMFIFVELTEGT
jgi:hypothetical protein